VGDLHLARNLSQARAGDQALEEGLEQLAASEPVVGLEGLGTEVPAAMRTAVPLDSVGPTGSLEEAFLLESPRD
jgi:hypothetical protein